MKLIRSFGYALKGLMVALKGQSNMQIHMVCFLVVIALGWFYQITSTEWVMILLAAGLVIVAELANTALETLTDLASPSKNELAGKAKDVAASAVLIAAIIALVIGVIIFGPYVFN